MLRWFLGVMLNESKKTIGDVDMEFAEHLRQVAPRRLMRFSMIKVIEGRRKFVPPSPFHAAGLAAAMVEDCGPCVQIHINLGLKDGVPEAQLQALVQRRLAAVDDDTALAFRYGEAVARSDVADDYRDAIRAKWGEQGLIELAFAIATARFYPGLKRGLGYAQHCEKVRIGSVETFTAKAA